MSTVYSNKVFTPEGFLEFLTGEKHTVNSPIIENIHRILKDSAVDDNAKDEIENLFDYPLSEIDEIVENNIPVLLVDVTEPNSEERELRWFELPSDYSSDEDCKNSCWSEFNIKIDDETDNLVIVFKCQKCGYEIKFNFNTVAIDLPEYCPKCGIHMTEEEDCQTFGTWEHVKGDETLFTCSKCKALKSIDNNTDLPKHCDFCGDYKTKRPELLTFKHTPILIHIEEAMRKKNPLFGGCHGCTRTLMAFCDMCKRSCIDYKEASKRKDLFRN